MPRMTKERHGVAKERLVSARRMTRFPGDWADHYRRDVGALLDEIEACWKERERFVAAAKKATEVYPAGHRNEGAYIVAFDEFERLEGLKSWTE